MSATGQAAMPVALINIEDMDLDKILDAVAAEVGEGVEPKQVLDQVQDAYRALVIVYDEILSRATTRSTRRRRNRCGV